MTRFGSAVARIDVREPGSTLPLLSVSQTRGVIRRSEISDKPPRAETLDVYKVCREGDVVFNKMSIRAGAMGVALEDGLVTYHYEVMRPRVGTDARYVVYLMKSDWFTGELIARERGIGAGDQGGSVRTTEVPFKVLRTIDAYIPPPAEQVAIADFLDRETAQIDTLIAKQQQLIETLRERRQASVDDAFKIAKPEDFAQLRRVITFVTSGSRGWGEYYADEGERFVRIGNLPRTSLVLRGDVQHVSLPPSVTEGERTRLRADDLLFSITAYLGSVAVVDSTWVDAYVSQHVALCRLDTDRVNPFYVGYYMLSTAGQQQLKEGAYGGTKMQLALDDIRTLVVPILSVEMQSAIVSRLDQELSKLDELIEKAEQLISLAKERRAALITAAVTGQIDVSRAA